MSYPSLVVIDISPQLDMADVEEINAENIAEKVL